jgi:exosortase family protein XrtG
MSASWLAMAVAVYLTGLLALRRVRYSLIGYGWAAFGMAGVLVLAGQVGEWNRPLGTLESSLMAWLGGSVGLRLGTLEPALIVIPDPMGWSVLQIGVECSALIEVSVFAGLMIFYPRFRPADRLARLATGVGATFLINLARLAVIVLMVVMLGKPAVPWAHALVGRLVFFVGILAVYWKLLTLPTLGLVRRDLEVSGRSVL